jgi:hypothetical protein
MVAVIIAFCYITDMTYYIVGSPLAILMFVMYCILAVYCFIGFVQSLRQLACQAMVARMIRNRDLLASCRMRFWTYFAFMSLTVAYFVFELCIHVVFPPKEWSGLNKSEAMALDLGLHETLEFLILAGAFFVYRAKLQDPFFDFAIEASVERIQQIEFIVVNITEKTGVIDADIIAIVPPKGNKYMIGSIDRGNT